MFKKQKDKKVQYMLSKAELKAKEAAEMAQTTKMLNLVDHGYIQTEGMEKSWKMTQDKLDEYLDIATKKLKFDLELELGPYLMNYTRNGKHMLIAGKLGHLACFDFDGNLSNEINVQESVYDAKWLHNETFYAVAQKKHTFIYDKSGVEIHCLTAHIEARKLEFLPYHFLLASIGNAGYLKYQDTSTGHLVAEHRTKLGKCGVIAQNPYNAIINLGHANGTVTLWSPSMTSALVKMQAHLGPVQALACDPSGMYMATSGLDGTLKIWDMRTYKNLSTYFTKNPASTLDFSQRGLLAVGTGSTLTVWKDIVKEKQIEPYMRNPFPRKHIRSLKFCPFQDILGCGHALGVSSIVIPGSGEPNFDTMEANPYQTKKQRQESEIHSLLDKIQPEMITLDPLKIGTVDRASAKLIAEERRLEEEAANPAQKFVPKKKARGKSSSMKRYLRRQAHIIEENREKLKQREEQTDVLEQAKPQALDRFVRKTD